MTELVGQLLHDRSTDMVYRVESVDEDAFPSEKELVLRPVYAFRQMSGGRGKRSKERREIWMAGTGHQSIRWAALVTKVTEADVQKMKERDE